jgi:1,2-beta-oligoglucan phosphorylase
MVIARNELDESCMTRTGERTSTTPRDGDLGLHRLENSVGLSISALPTGCIFAIEHKGPSSHTTLNQVLGSPVGGSIGRIYLRTGGPAPNVTQVLGPGAKTRFGAGDDRFVWDGRTGGVHHRLTLWLHPRESLWLWRLEITNERSADLPADVVLVQDLGLADRGFLMNNEAYASQYIDHNVAHESRLGPVVMSRQNLAQNGSHPWILHACLEGAAGFATDALQVFGPAHRDADRIGCDSEADLPNERLQHEVACVALQSHRLVLKPGASSAWTFVGFFEPNHTDASSDADLAKIGLAQQALGEFAAGEVALSAPVRSIVHDAQPLTADVMSENEIAARYPVRSHEEHRQGHLLSFFIPDTVHNRHVVLRDKEREVPRRHGTLLRTGQSMLPDEATMCVTGWMHGVFGAQLTLGNTSFHKLFSVSRDPYNITRASGLRIMVEIGAERRLLAVPSAFDIGLSDCRWIYLLDDRTITVHAVAAGDEPALQWQITVEGEPCRFLVFGHLVLGERELDHVGGIEIDATGNEITFRPDPASIFGQRYPHAVYHLAVSTRDTLEKMGGDELLYTDGRTRGGGYVALQTSATRVFCFAVVGSLRDATAAKLLAAKYAGSAPSSEMLAPAARYWDGLTRGLRITGHHADISALNTIFPWLAHNAMMHLTVPHGLEQYTGAAWGTRDVCQGPVEFFLSLEHDAPVKDILRIVFAQQYEQRGDWPQWFMLEPYSSVQDRHCHGDVIIWPLKALCDYLECTNDLAFLDEPVAWRGDADLARTQRQDPILDHVDKLLATLAERFIPGTRLLQYGDGDWNDSLQPVDPELREWMVSSWSVALLFQQINRYAEVLRRSKRTDQASALGRLAEEMRADFNRYLIRNDTVAGYAVFDPRGDHPKLLLHPTDTTTGLSYSLLPMTRGIIAGLFTAEQARHHLRLIREHLLFPDGVRLMDRPVRYRGGPQQLFRRAESASFFGREIGLMYVHAHLGYAEALAALGETDALWEALLVVNPIAITDRLANGSLRQRNAYFSSSDAAFCDRYQAETEWDDVKGGRIAVDGGWRIYSSGPGLYASVLLRQALGCRRYFGARSTTPLLPTRLGKTTLEMAIKGPGAS